MNIIGKGQVDGVEQGDILGQVAFIARLSRVAASAELHRPSCPPVSFCNTARNSTLTLLPREEERDQRRREEQTLA